MPWRIRLTDALGSPAGHDGELDLVVQLLRHSRLDLVVGTCNACGLLVEPELGVRCRNTGARGLLHMLGIIHSDGEIFARSFDGRQQPYALQGYVFLRGSHKLLDCR